MATTPPMFTTGISTLSPASTYPDLLLINNAGQGLNNTPSQVQDGLGNNTSMTISSNYINFDRSVSQFQLDGVALTASAATLNNITDVANGQYVLLTSNVQLPNASVLSATNGISLNAVAGNVTIQPALDSPLDALQQLVGGPNGILVYQNDAPFATVNLIGDATINIVNPDGTTGNPTFNVVTDTSRQRVNVQLNGVFESQKSQLNFIPGVGTGVNVVDNPGANRTDITISATPGSAFTFVAAAYATTTADLGATYNNGVSGVGATLTNAGVNAAFATDGTTPAQNSTILVKNQAAPAQNGIYTLTTVGDVATPWVLTRVNYFNSSSNIKPGDIIIVLNGTLYHDTGWIETATVNTVGTDPITFVSFGVTGTVTNVSGTAGQIDVVNGNTTPVISIDPTYIGQPSITTVGTIDTGTWNGTTVTVPFGGTGVTSTTAYGVVCGGTTTTNPLQNVGVGIAGQVLTSAGPGALPQWLPVAAASFNFAVHQVGHGLVVGNVIRIDNAGNYVAAQADSAAHATSVVGIVNEVVDANNFVYQFGGIVNVLAGLTVGDPYFLDPATPGGYTTTQPSTPGQVVLPLFYALSATDALWQPKSAIELM
jgi:hypothetical protein